MQEVQRRGRICPRAYAEMSRVVAVAVAVAVKVAVVVDCWTQSLERHSVMCMLVCM